MKYKIFVSFINLTFFFMLWSLLICKGYKKKNKKIFPYFCMKDPSYLESLRQDSKQVASLLENCIDSSIRQFACKKCNKYWWRRVPARKEVSAFQTRKIGKKIYILSPQLNLYVFLSTFFFVFFGMKLYILLVTNKLWPSSVAKK